MTENNVAKGSTVSELRLDSLWVKTEVVISVPGDADFVFVVHALAAYVKLEPKVGERSSINDLLAAVS